MKSNIFTSIIMSVVLLLCLAPMPYGYYTLVRFVSMVVFAAMAYGYWQNEKKPLAVTFGALALLFQPFAKIALGREMWNVVDIVVAIGLIVLVIADKKETR
jgi:hypothetical protein